MATGTKKLPKIFSFKVILPVMTFQNGMFNVREIGKKIDRKNEIIRPEKLLLGIN